MNMDQFMTIVNNSVYVVQAIVAIYGTYCAVVVITRINQKRFKTFEGQSQFLDVLEEPLSKADFESAEQICQGDRRAIVQLGYLAILNRKLGLRKVKELVLDYFQREVLSDLEHRCSGVSIAIKTEPMLGLLGTVLGMMQAFGKLAVSENVKAEDLASDISFALITTCVGLTISIPLMFILTSINVRMRKMEELVTNGMGRFFDMFQVALNVAAKQGK